MHDLKVREEAIEAGVRIKRKEEGCPKPEENDKKSELNDKIFASDDESGFAIFSEYFKSQLWNLFYKANSVITVVRARTLFQKKLKSKHKKFLTLRVFIAVAVAVAAGVAKISFFRIFRRKRSVLLDKKKQST